MNKEQFKQGYSAFRYMTYVDYNSPMYKWIVIHFTWEEFCVYKYVHDNNDTASKWYNDILQQALRNKVSKWDI